MAHLSSKTRTARAVCIPVLGSLLALCLAGNARAAGTPYYQSAIDNLSSYDVMRGYPDGDFHPELPVTRSEFVAMVNRAYGYTKGGETPFDDVPDSAWYADDIGIAYHAGYFTGTSATHASPLQTLTREQALVLLGRCMRLDETPGEVTRFTDGRDFSPFSTGYVDAAVAHGLVSGTPDGSFQPKREITRGEMAKMLDNALGTLVNTPGTTTLGGIYGSVTINSPGVTLKDTTIAGDLYISGGLGLDSVVLDNVRVLGRIVVAGSGESQEGEDSVVLRNVTADSLLVDSLTGQLLSLRAEGETRVDQADIRSDIYLQDRTRSGFGLLNITLDGQDGGNIYSLSGNLKNVVNKAPNSTLNVAQGVLDTLTMDEEGPGASLNILLGATVHTLNLDIGVPVTGKGDVETLKVNSDGSTVSMLPDKIEIRPSVTANIAGDTMDTRLGNEASQNPRLLAGYPKVRSVAPTSASGIFSSNKKGTVYWAVSALSDGSVEEAELISPSSYGSKAVQHGNGKLDASSSELTTAITGLTSGGTYYLSAVLVDDRGTRSPVKVTSFTTPDDSVPAFAEDYPAISKITKITGSDPAQFNAQAVVMATKTCQLYYALLPKNAAAPKPADFKAASISGNKGFGVETVYKNVEEYLPVNDVSLEELSSFDLYFWLTDADGAQSSQVEKLSFDTPDGTPPVFLVKPTANKVEANSVGLLCSVNEDATVYWVAVENDEDYPKKPVTNTTGEKEYAQLQISSGINGLVSGSVAAQANANTTFTVSGLEPESAYKVYFLAKDTAGNYSEFVLEYTGDQSSFMTPIHTLDTNPPDVWQEFTYYEGSNKDVPYASTSIKIVFDEDVQRYPFLSEDLSGSLTKFSGDNLARLLRDTIKLYDITNSSNGPQVIDRYNTATGGENSNWVIDYRNATAALDQEGNLVVEFPHNDDEAKSAINLRSGATYYFVIENIADTSAKQNQMGRTLLPQFTTISAQVALDDMDMFRQTIQYVYGTTQDTAIIHGAFSLDPVSTSTASDGRGWDMLIWANNAANNLNVKMDLFYTTHKLSDTGDPIYLDPAPDGQPMWKLLGELSYQINGTPEFRSLTKDTNFIHFFSTANPSLPFQNLNTLEEDVYYDFAFRVTQMGGSTVEGTWSDTVLVNISIVTGSSADLTDMAIKRDQSKYDELVNDTKEVADITVSYDLPLKAPFMDTEPAYFVADSPTFEPSDTFVTFSHQLNRPATIYYVITPKSLMPTTETAADNPAYPAIFTNASTDAEFKKIPEEPGDFNTSYSADHILFPLLQPAQETITKPDSFQGNDKIITGVLQDNGVSPTPDRINGLTKETDYVIYLVTKGTGSVYSRPQVFRFTTTETHRPAVTLRSTASSVSVTTTNPENGNAVNAVIDYVLIRDDENKLFQELKDPINLIDPETNSPYVALKALCTQWNQQLPSGEYRAQGSMYDQLTTEEKEKMYSLITGISRGESGSINTVVDSGNGVLVPDGRLSLDFTDVLDEGNNYILLVMGQHDQGSGYGFAAIRGIHLDSDEEPWVIGTSASVTEVPGNPSLICGNVTVSLNGGLYNFLRSTDATSSIRQIVDNAPTILPGSTAGSTGRDGSSISIESTLSPLNSDLKPILDASKYGLPIQTLEFAFGYTEDPVTHQLTHPNGIAASTYVLSITLTPQSMSGKTYEPFFSLLTGKSKKAPLRIDVYLNRTTDATTGITTWNPVVTVNDAWLEK